MQKYRVSFRYSKDGRFWTSTSKIVTAESDMSAIMQVESLYPYVQIEKVIRA